MNINIIKSKRKTISLSVIDETHIVVKAPIQVSNDFINNFINSKQNWINKQVDIIRNRNKNIEQFSSCPYLILGKTSKNFETVREYSRYYRKFCVKYITERIHYLANKFGFKYNNVSFKNYKSRWGCCTINNDIIFNYKLILLPEEVVDYVILHELCHTKYHNHQKRFHNLLNGICNNVKGCEGVLKKYSFVNRLVF